MLEISIELRGAAESASNSLWDHHYEQLFMHYTVISSIVIPKILISCLKCHCVGCGMKMYRRIIGRQE